MKTSDAEREIGRRLAAVRSGIRRAQWKRAGLLVAIALLGGLLLMMAADHFLAPLPQAARWILFCAWVAAVLAAAWAGLGPLLRKIGLVQVARWIEGRHPEIEERMSTVLELASGGAAGASEELLEALARAAGEDVGKVDARAEMKAVRAGKRWAKPALLLACATLLLFAVWPREAARLAIRAVAPFSKAGNAAAVKFTVTPGDAELLEGDAIGIAASYQGGAEKLELVMETADGTELVQPMSREGGAWHYRMDPVREGFRYRVRAGRGESDRFTATVWPLPGIARPRVTLDYPEYTGLPPRDEPLGRGIEAIRGTRATLSGLLNTAVEEGWLETGGERTAGAEIERAADGGRIRVSWTPQGEGGEAALRLRHRLGREVEALRFPVRVLEDAPPAVRWLSPVARELRVRPQEVLGLRYEIAEDFGLAAVQIEAKTAGEEPLRLPQDLPEKSAPGSKPARFRGSGELALGSLTGRWPGAGEIRLRVRAADTRPPELEGPGIGRSEWLVLKIDRGAESLARQEMRAEHDGAREAIERAVRAAREARERMDRRRGEMEKEEPGQEAVKDFAEARERLAAAREDLEGLSQRMEESVHAAKAEEVRKAAEQLARARQELESAPLQDGKEQRLEKLDNAREEAEAAVRNLEDIRNRMEQERRKIEELARLQELAQQQKELARQAGEHAARQAAEPPPEDWRQRQDGMEEALRQQLREQPEARAEALAAQAEEARALEKQARELGAAQQALAEESGRMPADAPAPQPAAEPLRKALEQEQAKIAGEAAERLAAARQDRSEAADLLPEAVAKAEEAAEELSKGEDRAAAESAAEAARALRDAADAGQEEDAAEPARAGMEALAGRQEEVAEALEALASGEAAEAMQALRGMQAARAEELARAVAEMPQAEGSGPMNAARDASRQGGEQAQAAARSGKPQEAADRHRQSAEQLRRSADALGRAAEEAARNAEHAKGQEPAGHLPSIPPGDLAEAFQAAARASGEPQAPEAARQAAQAAAALSRAAQAARASMQGRGRPAQPGMPPQPGTAPGEKPEEGPRMPEPDPGVPPELAKLGISAEDWEKIRSTLKADVGAAGGSGIPEEYRGLVKEYFETMADE